jgi:hypothetical protein
MLYYLENGGILHTTIIQGLKGHLIKCAFFTRPSKCFEVLEGLLLLNLQLNPFSS